MAQPRQWRETPTKSEWDDKGLINASMVFERNELLGVGDVQTLVSRPDVVINLLLIIRQNLLPVHVGFELALTGWLYRPLLSRDGLVIICLHNSFPHDGMRRLIRLL
jgi:hypothetical protein